MYLATSQERFRALYSTLVTSSTITAPSATATAPTGEGIYDTPINSVKLAFYGTDTADQTFTARVTGWSRVGDVWIPVPLLALSGILGTMTGVAGQTLTASHLLGDTLTVSTAFTTAYEIINPTANQVAIAKVDVAGCERVQVQVAKGTAVSVGVLAASY